MAELSLKRGNTGYFATLIEYGKRRYYHNYEIKVERGFILVALEELPEHVLDHLYKVAKRHHEAARVATELCYVNWDMTKECVL